MQQTAAANLVSRGMKLLPAEDAEGHPGFPRQRTKGPDVLADLVEHADLHDARRASSCGGAWDR
jgi:hypothetical protein